MYFIDDIHLPLSLCWFVSSLVDEVADIVYSGITRGIDLDDIEHATRIECFTVLTFMTWISILQIFAINSLCQYTSARCLSSSTTSREDISVSYTTLSQTISEYRRNQVLSNDRIPITRAIEGVERHALRFSEKLKVKSTIRKSPENTKKSPKKFRGFLISKKIIRTRLPPPLHHREIHSRNYA